MSNALNFIRLGIMGNHLRHDLIYLLGHDADCIRELALYRAEFLRQAGFNVLIAGDADEAIRIMQRGAFDAIILSYTLSTETVQYLTDAARGYCPDCPVVAIAESSMLDRRIEPDAVALADEGPSSLLSALNRVLEMS